LTFSTLMVCMRVGGSNAEPLAVAADVAKRFGAHVVGVAARQASAHAFVRGAGPLEPHDYDPKRFAEQAEAAEREFRAAFSGAEAHEWRTQMTFGPAWEFVAEEARAADLVVAATDGEPMFFPSGQADVGDLLMRAGRPILVAPQKASGFAFRQALVCFKNAREARRALADSLPVLKAMARVHVAEIVEAGTADDARRRLADVRAWLKRHGIEASCDAVAGGAHPVRRLSALARDLDADLIVAGAFGHSRLREWAFGGVTGELILRSDRCVLASH